MELREVYQALSALDCAVTRGWPQALVPLPSLAFSGCEDSLLEDGTRLFRVELLARAASPEGADALAAGACDVMSSLGLRRVYMKDGAEKDRDTFTKQMRFELLTGGPAAERLSVSLAGREWEARVLGRGQRRDMLELRSLADAGSRPAPGPAGPLRLSLRLPREALPDAVSAYEAALPVSAGGEEMLPLGYELDESGLRLSLCAAGGEG